MKLSLIIPTRNRSKSLAESLGNLALLRKEVNLEVIIVDNNSGDETKKVAKRFPFVKYVFEKNTAFSCARKSGVAHASGDILIFMDDDALLCPGSLTRITKIFSEYPRCGLIAGKVAPSFEGKPPAWTLACQAAYNGWSIFTPENIGLIKNSTQTVPYAIGPLMAIRTSLYHQIGGFPPDTVGVETDDSNISFRKLYVGPGDYGLSYLVRKSGWQIYYDEKVSCQHQISKSRYSRSFWRSRLIGEGQQVALTQRRLYHFSNHKLNYIYYVNSLLYVQKKTELSNPSTQLSMVAELRLHYLRAYLETVALLKTNPGLGKYLWQLGLKGISNKNYHAVLNNLPKEYLAINNPDLVYSNEKINSLSKYQARFEILPSRVYESGSLVKIFFLLPFSRLLLQKLEVLKNLIEAP